MSTLAKGDMETLMTYWAEDGVLEFPFHPPGAVERVQGKQAISEYFNGTKGYKQPTSFPITASYPLEGGNGVILEFDGHLKNTQTGELYTNSYIVVFKFREGKLILFREFFDSLKRQKYESHN